MAELRRDRVPKLAKLTDLQAGVQAGPGHRILGM